MNYLETKYMLWFYAKQPKNKILDFIGTRLNSKIMKEQEKEANKVQ